MIWSSAKAASTAESKDGTARTHTVQRGAKLAKPSQPADIDAEIADIGCEVVGKAQRCFLVVREGCASQAHRWTSQRPKDSELHQQQANNVVRAATHRNDTPEDREGHRSRN